MLGVCKYVNPSCFKYYTIDPRLLLFLRPLILLWPSTFQRDLSNNLSIFKNGPEIIRSEITC